MSRPTPERTDDARTTVARQVLLPELRLLKTRRGPRGGLDFSSSRSDASAVELVGCPLPSRRRTRLYAWPDKVGIDGHFFQISNGITLLNGL